MKEYIPSDNRYSKLNYIRCGKSGIKLPPISLGLWHNFGFVDSFESAREIIRHAFDSGITHFDLANNYGPPPGSAETNFGKILKRDLAGYRDELVISTKAGYLMWPGPYGEYGSRKYLLSSLDQSLQRMGLEYVDIFYSHRPDRGTPLEETMGALAHAVRSGKALYAGISNYPAKDTARAIEILSSEGVPCLIHQPKYSMLDRWVEKDLLTLLERAGVGCIPFSPLAQGLLSNKYLKGIPEDSRAASKHGFLQASAITKQLLSKLSELNQVALNRDQSLAQLALSWILKDKRITSVLIGVSSVIQLKDNLAALQKTTFTEDELIRIDKILSK